MTRISGGPDDTGNEARATRIVALARERGWSLEETVRYAVACGYLVAHWSDAKQRRHEAGIVQSFNTPQQSKEMDR